MIVPRKAPSAADVAGHYDDLDPFYREIWGRHVHHGYWATGRETPEEAVEALVDLMADRLSLAQAERVCDIGCGYGATALRLARTRGVHVTGITISAVQAQHAGAAAAGSAQVEIIRGDWLANVFPDAAFDAVFSIESSEHMVDKARFFGEAFRTLRPGGRMGVFAWLAREEARPWEVRHLLEPICREGRLPGMGTQDEYRALAKEAGFRVESFEDLSARVSRTWRICARRVAGRLATASRYRRFLLDPQARNRDFAWSLLRILVAYRTGSMRYGLLVVRKPS
jgi:tocopherol O-methyltransferase